MKFTDLKDFFKINNCNDYSGSIVFNQKLFEESTKKLRENETRIHKFCIAAQMTKSWYVQSADFK